MLTPYDVGQCLEKESRHLKEEECLREECLHLEGVWAPLKFSSSDILLPLFLHN